MPTIGPTGKCMPTKEEKDNKQRFRMCKPVRKCVQVASKDKTSVNPRESRAANNPLRCIHGFKQCSNRVCYPAPFFLKPPSIGQYQNYRTQFKLTRDVNEGQARKAVAANTKMQKHAKNIRLAQNMNDTRKKKSLRDKARIELEQRNKERAETRKANKERKREKVDAMASSETSSAKLRRKKTKRDNKIARRLARRKGVGSEENGNDGEEPPDQFDNGNDGEEPPDQFDNGNDGAEPPNPFEENGNDGAEPPNPFEDEEKTNPGNTELEWNEDYVKGSKQAPSYSQYKGASTIAEFVNKGRKKSSDAAIRADFNYFLNVLKKLSSAEPKPADLSVKEWNSELKERLKAYQNDTPADQKAATASSAAAAPTTRSAAIGNRLRSSTRKKYN